MEVEAAKLIGAGLATIALAGAGIGIGNIFASYVSAAIRNPSAAPKVFGNVLLGFALTEAIALFALLIAFLILFAFCVDNFIKLLYTISVYSKLNSVYYFINIIVVVNNLW